MITTENVSIDQIDTLRTEARQAGDKRMAETCTRALAGNRPALAKVVEALSEAQAMREALHALPSQDAHEAFYP